MPAWHPNAHPLSPLSTVGGPPQWCLLVNLDSTKPQSWEWKWEEDVLIAVNRGGAAGGATPSPI